MENFLSRIVQFIENEGITLTFFEREIGASKGVLSRALRNNTDVQSKWLSIIVEKYPQLSPDWLLTGKGSMYREEGARQIVNGSGNQAIGGSTINVAESEIEYYRKRVSELEKLVEQKDKVIDVLSGK